MPDNNLIKLVRKTLIENLRGSVGTAAYQHVYVRRKSDGQELDTMSGGELSCAFFVSGTLAAYGLIDNAHSTVTTVVARMKEAGWYAIDASKPGAVAYWPEYEGHEHIGFVLDNDEFISNSLTKRVPHLHEAKLPDGRTPTAYYWHQALDQD